MPESCRGRGGAYHRGTRITGLTRPAEANEGIRHCAVTAIRRLLSCHVPMRAASDGNSQNLL